MKENKMAKKNQATELIEFLNDKGGIIGFPGEKDYEEWWALLDKMKVPRMEPSNATLQNIRSHGIEKRIVNIVVEVLETFKEATLDPIKASSRNGKTYVIGDKEVVVLEQK
jgi:hypothetical protein